MRFSIPNKPLLCLALVCFSANLSAKATAEPPATSHGHKSTAKQAPADTGNKHKNNPPARKPLSVHTPPTSKSADRTPAKPPPDPALLEQADSLYRNGQYEQAAKLYRELAEQGDAPAQTTLGTMYLSGQGLAKDVEEGVAWYVKAARQGYAAAQNNLGMLYSATKDYKQAMDWYLKAAGQDYADAQFNLGVMYEKSLGVSRDQILAIAWYRKAAARGNEKARKHLIRLGVSVE